MSPSPATKIVIPAESLSNVESKMPRDSTQRPFPVNGAFSVRHITECKGATDAKDTATADEYAMTEGDTTNDCGATAHGYAIAEGFKATHGDAAPVINEQNVAHRFSKAAVQYNKIASIQRVIAKQALANLPHALRGEALDIGCGTGIHTQALFNRGAAATGVDIAEGMLVQARKKYSDPTFVQGSALSLPFPETQFSLVFSSMALQWASDTDLVAREIARVQKEGGVAELAIMVAGSFNELKTARKVAQLPQAQTYMPTTAQWVNSFKQSGLSLQRVITKDYVDRHTDIMSLLRSVKGVGAGETGRKQPALSRKDIKKLAMAYRNINGVDGTFALTYRVSHFRLEKR